MQLDKLINCKIVKLFYYIKLLNFINYYFLLVYWIKKGISSWKHFFNYYKIRSKYQTVKWYNNRYKRKFFKKNYYIINSNVNLKRINKKKLLLVIRKNLLYPQIFSNTSLFNKFTGLYLEHIFFRRFRYHFFKHTLYQKELFNNNNILYKIKKINKRNKFFLFYIKIYYCLNWFSKIYNRILMKRYLKFLKIYKHYFKRIRRFFKYLLNYKNINYFFFSFKIKVLFKKKINII